MAKMRGIGTDGAATMIGRHNGIVAHFKTITPSAIGVHCVAHHLDLASSQAGDSVSYVKSLIQNPVAVLACCWLHFGFCFSMW